MQSTTSVASETQFAIVAGQIRLRLEHNPASGTMLTHLANADGRDFLQRPNVLWKIEMLHREHRQVELDMRQSPPKIRRGSDQVRLVWNDVRIGSTSERVTVKATINLNDEAGEIAWHYSVEDVPDDWSVFRVHFPRLDLIAGADDAMILPDDRGVICRDPVNTMPTGGIHERIRRRPYPHGGFSMQFLALQRGEQFLYLAAHDPAAHLKTFFLGPDKENDLVYVHPYVDTEIHYGDDWRQAFPWIMRIGRGDWYDVAQIYRKFAMTGFWAEKGPLVEMRKTPLWYQQIGAVTLRLMRGPGFEDHDVLAERAFLGTPIVCHYYMWHQNAFDANYPFFFPAVPTFRKTIKTLEAHDVHVMPYVNFVSADMTVPAWQQGLNGSASQITPNGDLDVKVWSQNRACARLCPAADMTQQLLHMTAMRLFDQGVSAVYFDEVAASAVWPCYDPRHGHPLGGGTTYVDASNRSLRKVREEAAIDRAEPVITTEGCAEAYIGQVDAMLAGNACRGNALPLFETVYHDHVMMYGRYVWTPELMEEKYAGAIESKHAQHFVWGSQIGWCDVPISQIIQRSPKTANFLRHLAHTWKHSYDFLAQGRMLRPLDLSDQIKPVTRRWQTSWTDEIGTEVTLMPVLNSIWQRADGAIAVVLVNITDEPISLLIKLASPQSLYAQAMAQGRPADTDSATLSRLYPLPQRVAAEVRVLNGDEPHAYTADGDSERGFPVTVAPLSAMLLTLGSEKSYGQT